MRTGTHQRRVALQLLDGHASMRPARCGPELINRGTFTLAAGKLQ